MMTIATCYITVGIITVGILISGLLSDGEGAPQPLVIRNTNIDINRRSVSCLSGFYFDSATGGCEGCITCGSGELFNDDCYGTRGPGTCSPCGRGSYQAKENHADVSCPTCTHCQHRVVISGCTKTTNTVCGDCVPGYYERVLFGSKSCLPCPTRGNLPKKCRKPPTTVPPVPSPSTSSPVMTSRPLTTTSVPDNTTPVLTTTWPVTPRPSVTTPFPDLKMAPSLTPGPTTGVPVDNGAPFFYKYWVPVTAVFVLFFVIGFGCLVLRRGCKSCDGSLAGYSLPGESETHVHADSYGEACGENDQAGIPEGVNGEGEHLQMLPVKDDRCGTGEASNGSSTTTSATSSPRDSFHGDIDSLVSFCPSLSGSIQTVDQEIFKTSDVLQEREMHRDHFVPETDKKGKELLALLCENLNNLIDKGMLDGFKSFCRLSEKLGIRTIENCESFSDCVCHLSQCNDLPPKKTAALLFSYFDSINHQRCLKMIREKFPHVASAEDEDVYPSKLHRGSKGTDFDRKYYWNIVRCLEKYGMKWLKFKDITSILNGIDSMLESDIKGVGNMYEISVALQVNHQTAHVLQHYGSLERLLTMSQPDLTVIEFVDVLTLQNRIAAVKEIYNKLCCDHTLEELKACMFCRQNKILQL